MKLGGGRSQTTAWRKTGTKPWNVFWWASRNAQKFAPSGGHSQRVDEISGIKRWGRFFWFQGDPRSSSAWKRGRVVWTSLPIYKNKAHPCSSFCICLEEQSHSDMHHTYQNKDLLIPDHIPTGFWYLGNTLNASEPLMCWKCRPEEIQKYIPKM